MAVKWTPARDQNLLLLIIADVKVDFGQLATKWKQAFPDEDFHPTAKAVSEHVAALKRKIGGSSGRSAVAVSTPKSKPRVPNGPQKTPVSKGKRARSEMMSADDDSEAEKAIDFDTPLPKRTTPSRRSAIKKYTKEVSDSEDDNMVVKAAIASPNTDGPVHTPGNIISPRPSIARSKSNRPNLGYFKESDVDAEDEEDLSDFTPFT
ncbi:uncharacterized protein RCC_07459 [Ramularia collo-cygni]|uniref:Uncharacterized protein n=1 Tax=Ramularia collo-cygni TaxID=112498 RepID=A0A2D3V4I4_9PEZI|nr:uncharacterized protein RCC_07459 [Ramularia collo-cygni]CZT21595.1 uncharacterized protein RCC_07459 [Ramularia collo-cygni]